MKSHKFFLLGKKSVGGLDDYHTYVHREDGRTIILVVARESGTVNSTRIAAKESKADRLMRLLSID